MGHPRRQDGGATKLPAQDAAEPPTCRRSFNKPCQEGARQSGESSGTGYSTVAPPAPFFMNKRVSIGCMLNPMEKAEAYEAYVRQSPERILEEAGEFFMERGNVHQALRDLAHRLDESRIPYAIIGAMAIGQHGMPRMTLDINLLLTADGLRQFKQRHLGRGYVPAFPGAEKTFRASETGVRIEVITTGEYPGDGVPKPVVFPDPAAASVEIGGIRVIALERLIELKLASGMTAAHRLRDLADVLDMIRALGLPESLGDRLDASVRGEYRKLWSQAQQSDKLRER